MVCSLLLAWFSFLGLWRTESWVTIRILPSHWSYMLVRYSLAVYLWFSTSRWCVLCWNWLLWRTGRSMGCLGRSNATACRLRALHVCRWKPRARTILFAMRLLLDLLISSITTSPRLPLVTKCLVLVVVAIRIFGMKYYVFLSLICEVFDWLRQCPFRVHVHWAQLQARLCPVSMAGASMLTEMAEL